MRERVGEHAAKSLRAAAVAACAAIGLAVAAGGLAGLPSLAQTNTTVKVASAGIASDIGFFIADKKGYFRAEGLDVQLSTLANSPQMIGPLGMGQLDVGGGTVAASLYNAVAQNIAIRAVADKGSMRPGYGFSGLLVRKDLVDSGRYKTFKDLKGMTIAVGTFGSANSSAVNEALKRGGLTWDDAHMVALTFPQHLAAYANKAIDASMTNEPTASEAVKNGLAVRIAGNDEIYPDQQTAVVLYSEMFARQRPQLAMKFMRAYIKAVREYNDALKDGKIAGPNAEEVISILSRIHLHQGSADSSRDHAGRHRSGRPHERARAAQRSASSSRSASSCRIRRSRSSGSSTRCTPQRSSRSSAPTSRARIEFHFSPAARP